jgi:hypothetical protein
MGDEMNKEKIRRTAAATDIILEGCNRALQALQAHWCRSTMSCATTSSQSAVTMLGVAK